jgi:hypothetical protein
MCSCATTKPADIRAAMTALKINTPQIVRYGVAHRSSSLHFSSVAEPTNVVQLWASLLLRVVGSIEG